MMRSSEELMLIPGEQRVRFRLPAQAIGLALAEGQRLALEPKFIECNFEPLLEESSSTPWCRLATFGHGSTPSQNELSSSRIKRCAPA